MKLRDQLAAALPFLASDLDVLIETAQFRYKVYQIPKRREGKFRTIAQPTAEIKLLQSWLVSNALRGVRIHNAAMAYRNGMSIAAHAKVHVGSDFLLKLDFQNFFNSISITDVSSFLKDTGRFADGDVSLICQLVCWRNRSNGHLCLSMGAPSSPFLSNAVLYKFDLELSRIARAYKVKYSRYADDIALSSNRRDVLPQVRKELDALLGSLPYPKLNINEEKTVSVSRAAHRSLVGLTLTPVGQISLGRAKKKALRSLVYRFTGGAMTPEDVDALRGNLAFAWSIEPEYIFSLIRTYGEATFLSLDLPFANRLPENMQPPYKA